MLNYRYLLISSTYWAKYINEKIIIDPYPSLSISFKLAWPCSDSSSSKPCCSGSSWLRWISSPVWTSKTDILEYNKRRVLDSYFKHFHQSMFNDTPQKYIKIFFWVPQLILRDIRYKMSVFHIHWLFNISSVKLYCYKHKL